MMFALFRFERSNLRHAATVFAPTIVCVFGAGGTFFAVGDGRDLRTAHAEAHVILSHRGRAFLSKAKVVFGRATLIAMALDQNIPIGMFFNGLIILTQGIAGVGTQSRLV